MLMPSVSVQFDFEAELAVIIGKRAKDVSAGAAMVAVLRVANPNAAGSLLPPCPFHWLTGIYCPGCGTTRALHALLHLDIRGAWAMNPLLVLSLPFVALLLANQFFTLPAGWRPIARRIGDARPWAVVLITYAILRNLPWEPFAWLAPGVA